MDLFDTLWGRLDLSVYGSIKGMAIYPEPNKVVGTELFNRLLLVYKVDNDFYSIASADFYNTDLVDKLGRLYKLYKKDISNILGHEVILAYVDDSSVCQPL